LGARAANELVLLAVDVIEAVGRTRIVSAHYDLIVFDFWFYSLAKEKKS
jgi:hypothetical protein